MNQDFVGSLNIGVRTTGAVPQNLEEAAQRFTSEVLAQAGQSLHRLAPERVVFVRHLMLNWRLEDHQLGEPHGVNRYAQDIVDRLESHTPVTLPITAGDTLEDVVVFADEAHWRAAHLFDQATGNVGDAWFFKSLAAEGDPIAALCEPDRHEIAWQMLTHLAKADLLATIVESVSMEKLEALAAALLPGQPVIDANAVDAALAARLATLAERLPEDLPPKVRSLVLHIHARSFTDAEPIAAAAGVAEALSLLGIESAKTGHKPYSGSHPNETPQQSPPVPVDSSRERGQTKVIEKAALPQAEEKQAQPPVQVIVTRAAGLFYLLNCALELNIGEILWMACLPESQILANAAAMLLGDELSRDPALSLFAGTETDESVPAVTVEQQEEVSNALLANLTAALPRRGLAEYPQILLRLEGRDENRVLIVTPFQSPFVIFARLAPTPGAVQNAIEAFLNRWPPSAPPPRASPALAELDPNSRVRRYHELEAGITPLSPPSKSAFTTALLAQTIGSLCHLFEARTANTFLTTNDLVATYLEIPGRVFVEPEGMTVAILEKKIDLRLRRAGLDRDPGWVPWLQRTVRFMFE